MREPEPIRRVAQAHRAMHRGPSLPARFITFRIVEEYRRRRRRTRDVPRATPGARVAGIVDGPRPGSDRLCHNDLLNAKLHRRRLRIRIVDWEYAATGDVFFDLANFSVNHGLPPTRRQSCSPPTGERAAGGRARAGADAVHVRLP